MQKIDENSAGSPMKRGALAGIVGLAIMAGSGTVIWALADNVKPDVVTVASVDAVTQAIASARKPVTIRLQPGYYPKIEIIRQTGTSGQPVTIESADPRQRAVIGELTVAFAPSTIVRGVDFERQEGQEGRRYLAFFRSSPGARVIDAHFRGALDSATPQIQDYALMLRDSDDSRVEQSRFSGLRYGIGFYNADRLVVARNEIRDMQTDGIRGEGSDDLLIVGNVIGDFHPAPKDHADGIQLWTNNQTEPTRRITVRGNLIARGNGNFIQGIFIRDTFSKLPFEQLNISGNLVIGANYNAIAVLGAKGVTIANNIVAGYPDQKSWIRFTKAQDAHLEGNSATWYNRDDASQIQEARNVTRQATDRADEIRTMLAAWVTQNKDLDQSGPYIQHLLTGPQGTIRHTRSGS